MKVLNVVNVDHQPKRDSRFKSRESLNVNPTWSCFNVKLLRENLHIGT